MKRRSRYKVALTLSGIIALAIICLAQTNLGPIKVTTTDVVGQALAPSNPPSGTCREYFNTTSGQESWVNAAGGSCGPSVPGGITGATPNGGLVVTGANLGMRTDCSSTQVLQWNGSSWICAANSGGSGGQGVTPFDQCTPDTSGNVFYTVTSLTGWAWGTWQYIPTASATLYCTIYVQTANGTLQTKLEMAANATSGTYQFQVCDAAIPSGGNFAAPTFTCAPTQNYSAGGVAYARIGRGFTIQSFVSSGYYVIVKISGSTTGSPVGSNVLVAPAFVNL